MKDRIIQTIENLPVWDFWSKQFIAVLIATTLALW
jgi:hypothetical protein